MAQQAPNTIATGRVWLSVNLSGWWWHGYDFHTGSLASFNQLSSNWNHAFILTDPVC